MILLKKLNIW